MRGWGAQVSGLVRHKHHATGPPLSPALRLRLEASIAAAPPSTEVRSVPTFAINPSTKGGLRLREGPCPRVSNLTRARVRSSIMYLCADHSLPHSGQVGVALGEARAQVGQVAAEVASDAPRQIVVAVRYEKQIG